MNPRPRKSRPLLLLVALVAVLCGRGAPVLGATATETILSRPDLAAYRGWIKYLNFLANDAAQRTGAESGQAVEARDRLASWENRILADPALLAQLRGVQEWAYESLADDSGQPFKIMIPTDYDPAHPAPVSLYLYGLSGNHLEHATGMVDKPGAFELSVLGRSRGGWYVGLSEADVLHVLDYVQKHWSIHLDRVHLNGGSMGGGATFLLGSRYPHRFASGRPACGYAEDQPLGNLRTFPIYATHSDDDWTVPVVQARGPIARLNELGGTAILDETSGLGHAAWNYTEGNARAAAWETRQVRARSRDIRHLDFTALDGGARRSWWAEIAEWGDEPKPARFVVRATPDNTLHVQLENIAQLRVMLAASPLDAQRPLHVSINGRAPTAIAAPLPGAITLRHPDVPDETRELLEEDDRRAHTPGGPLQLYNGEPLLIVYGTRGDAATNVAMRAAAEAASKSSDSNWQAHGGEASPDDGVPHAQLLYSRLRTKPDHEVTEDDLRRCHLVLIGTAAQNALVARTANRLPVRLSDGAIQCTDGFSVPAANRALGLVHYNPLAPSRLVYWVASDDPRAYVANSPVVTMVGHKRHGRTWVGADLLITDAAEMTLVASRSFDRRWQWRPRDERYPSLGDALRTQRALGLAVADCLRRATGAEFALAALEAPEENDAIAPTITRTEDIVPLHYFEPIATMDLTGTELLELAGYLEGTNSSTPVDGWVRMHPRPDPAIIHGDQRYRVACSVRQTWTVGRVGQIAPARYRHTDLQVGDAIEQFLGRVP